MGLSLSYSVSHHQGLMVKWKAPGKSYRHCPSSISASKGRECQLDHTQASPQIVTKSHVADIRPQQVASLQFKGRGHTQDSVQGKYVGRNLMRECHFCLGMHNTECITPGGMLSCDEDQQ